MISIITVNFNDAATTLRLLDSLASQSDKDFEVFVVDNASEPDDRAALGEYAATSTLNLELLFSETNRGFSGGNNLAIRKALEQARFADDRGSGQESQWLVLINNDTTVPDDFIARLRPQLGRSPAVLGLPLREEGRIAYAGIVRWLTATLPHVYDLSERHELLQKDCALYAIGAALAVHSDVFERIGLLDERYFLYFEDADYSVRACRAGVPVRFLNGPVVAHAVSKSTSRLGPPTLLYYHARNALLFNRRLGPWWVRILLPFAAVYGIFLQILKIMVMPSERARSRAVRDGIIDFYAGRFGPLKKHGDDRT